MTITARNEFHGTSVSVRPAQNGSLSLGQVAKIRRELCGMKGCSCRTVTRASEANGDRVGIELEYSLNGGKVISF
jgi:hypothetical protein